ncbi:MAG: DUF99 family protein [Methanosarcinales archaeon]|nr:DUF99 family protein [Methanosarcinales archaeon]
MHLQLQKKGLRVLGIAESFVRTPPLSRLAGVVMRGDLRIDGAALAEITVAGDDATAGVLEIFQELDRSDVNAVMLNGAVISWFNIIDLQQVYEELGLPLVCLTYEESGGLDRYIQEYFAWPEEKLRLYHRLGEREALTLKTGYQVYARALGIDLQEAKALLNRFTLDGRVPEPLRVARLMARSALRLEGGGAGCSGQGPRGRDGEGKELKRKS